MRRHARHGVTLIEVLLALLLIMVSLLGLSSALTYALLATRYATHARVAQEVAQSYLEQAQRVPFSGLVNGNDFPGSFTVVGVPNGTGTIEFVDNLSGSTSSNPNSKRVTVTVTWNAGTSDHGTVALSTIRTGD